MKKKKKLNQKWSGHPRLIGGVNDERLSRATEKYQCKIRYEKPVALEISLTEMCSFINRHGDSLHSVDADEERLLRFLGFDIRITEKRLVGSEKKEFARRGLDSLDVYEYTMLVKGYPGQVIYEIENQNAPFDNPEDGDFFDILRELDRLMKLLVGEIDAKNERDEITNEMYYARAAMKSLQEFLSVDHPERAPDKVPNGLVTGVEKRMKTENWLSISERAAKCAESIANTIVKLFSSLF